MKVRTFLTAATVAAFLAACGGGGSGYDPTPAAATAPALHSYAVPDGDSLADVQFQYTTWPVQLDQQETKVDFIQAAIAGTTAELTLDRYDARVHPWAPVVTGRPAVYILVVGTNNMITDTVATGWPAIQQLWAKARADGFKVIASTIKPVTDGGAYQDRVVELNGLIRANAASYDALLELDVLFPDSNDTALLVDGLHFTAEGNRVVLKAVKPLLDSLLP